jgi:hypothetical protein
MQGYIFTTETKAIAARQAAADYMGCLKTQTIQLFIGLTTTTPTLTGFITSPTLKD